MQVDDKSCVINSADSQGLSDVRHLFQVPYKFVPVFYFAVNVFGIWNLFIFFFSAFESGLFRGVWLAKMISVWFQFYKINCTFCFSVQCFALCVNVCALCNSTGCLSVYCFDHCFVCISFTCYCQQ